MPYKEAKNGGEGTNGVYALGGIAAALCGPSCRVIQVPPVVQVFKKKNCTLYLFHFFYMCGGMGCISEGHFWHKTK